MKDKGALFLTHLDIDGCAVEGKESLLEAIRDYKPSSNSLCESIAKTKDFVQSIRWVPKSDDGVLWFYDVIFVALRNILYCENALRSKYLFGYVDAASAFGMTDSEVDVMLRLRDGKYSYRRKAAFKDSQTNYDLETVIQIVNRVVHQGLSFCLGGRTDWWAEWNYDYWDERIVERAIINNEVADAGFRELLRDHNYHRRELTDVLKDRIHSAQQNHPAGAPKARAADGWR